MLFSGEGWGWGWGVGWMGAKHGIGHDYTKDNFPVYFLHKQVSHIFELSSLAHKEKERKQLLRQASASIDTALRQLRSHRQQSRALSRPRVSEHSKERDETLGFTSTETIKAYCGRGSWGVRNFISNTYSLHCHHQNDSELRWAVV